MSQVNSKLNSDNLYRDVNSGYYHEDNNSPILFESVPETLSISKVVLTIFQSDRVAG